MKLASERASGQCISGRGCSGIEIGYNLTTGMSPPDILCLGQLWSLQMQGITSALSTFACAAPAWLSCDVQNPVVSLHPGTEHEQIGYR